MARSVLAVGGGFWRIGALAGPGGAGGSRTA
jgi:hypothetical protein